ncbi:MAG: hypothetical protein COU31_04135 [Candidatus Magasanikbacteria bacterium CG10_big_fil_rev_8_21_14_0_10_40_10]|uniref:Uncharacterized protein n=1 Tax=Candidatus Magasanikbacteria bacterium CG10_big_fil_rev_8_21_14_0_10_40_10 TaxID=1974648 RepID=A0A2M6W398_9BACT|nr:MAG: hypothetical protein COU31_04135 [Candidatus Magasanikbacteria bacterium CG10_big_fil_rev_8_21_14_0_10_40_10]
MSFLSRLLGGNQLKQTDSNPVEQAVIVNFSYLGGTDLSQFFQLEEELESAINTNNVGEYDGNEVATDGSHGTLFIYGTDADKLFDVVSPILKKAKSIKDITVTVRYGPPADGVKEKVVKL